MARNRRVSGGEPAVGAGRLSRGTRLAEFGLLFVALPAAIWLLPVPRIIIPTLVVLGVSVIAILLRDPTFDRGRLIRWSGVRRVAWPMLLRFVVFAAAIAAAVAIAQPERLFAMPRERPRLLLMIAMFYPLLSAYPQEVIFRAFFFHRYGPAFGRSTVGASALAFGFAHIILNNWVSVAFTTIGGWFFARTYARSGSVAAAWVEHTLYGIWVFTVGLGPYFYGGSVGRVPPSLPPAASEPAPAGR